MLNIVLTTSAVLVVLGGVLSILRRLLTGRQGPQPRGIMQGIVLILVGTSILVPARYDVTKNVLAVAVCAALLASAGLSWWHQRSASKGAP